MSNKTVYLALGIQADGQRDVLGLWVEQTEGATFWLKVFNDLKTRGCQDILIAAVGGLEGLAEASRSRSARLFGPCHARTRRAPLAVPR